MLHRVQYSCPITGATPALQPHELGLQARGVVSEKLMWFGFAEKTAAAVVTEAVMALRLAADHITMARTAQANRPPALVRFSASGFGGFGHEGAAGQRVPQLLSGTGGLTGV